MIAHNPLCKDVHAVAKMFSERDGVDVNYVCTTAICDRNISYDIFYRKTPHPQFGNRYFGIRFVGKNMHITNADDVDGMVIACVYNDQGLFEYSRSVHDYLRFDNGNMIDGGREYIRASGKRVLFDVINGALVKRDK